MSLESLLTKSWLTEEEHEQMVFSEMQDDALDEKRAGVKKVDIAWLDNFLEEWENNPKEAPKGQYWARNENTGACIAVDNSTGDAWTEEFSNPDLCIHWLINPELDGRVCADKPSDAQLTSGLSHKNTIRLKR